MNDVTNKFQDMVSAFQCDFSLAKEGTHSISELDPKIKTGDPRIMKDIDLLEELECGIRYGKLKIVEVSEEDNAIMEKNKAKKPLKKDFLDVCPECGACVTMTSTEYCSRYGQKLDRTP